MKSNIFQGGEGGQAIVEAALLLPLFTLLFLTMLNLGLGVLDKQIIQAAASEAARYATMAVPEGDPRPSLAAVEAEAVAGCAGAILARNPAVTVYNSGLSRGDLLTVTISADENWISFPAGSISATARARYQ